jgi:hypothetical protein
MGSADGVRGSPAPAGPSVNLALGIVLGVVAVLALVTIIAVIAPKPPRPLPPRAPGLRPSDRELIDRVRRGGRS